MLGYLTPGAHTTCTQKEWFNTYKPFDGSSVLMGNDTVYKTVGIGNICMRMFDEQVWTLTNVHYVSNLRKNLLLLGALKAQKCKFSGADGGIKVTKGSMMIFKGDRTTNLYKMIESVIVSDTSAATKKDDTTRLWHTRLGHMSERDLQVLNDKGALPCIKYYKLDLHKFYIMYRQCRIAFSTSQHKTKGLLDLIHTDVWGTSPAASIGVQAIMLRS